MIQQPIEEVISQNFKTKKERREQRERGFGIFGLVLIGISMLVYFLPGWFGISFRDFGDNGFFFTNFIIAAVYFVSVLINTMFAHGWKVWKLPERLYVLSLVLFGISAFALNHSFHFFSRFSEICQCSLNIFLYHHLLGG